MFLRRRARSLIRSTLGSVRRSDITLQGPPIVVAAEGFAVSVPVPALTVGSRHSLTSPESGHPPHSGGPTFEVLYPVCPALAFPRANARRSSLSAVDFTMPSSG